MKHKLFTIVIASITVLLSACAATAPKIPPEEFANYALIRTTGNSRFCKIDNVNTSSSLLCLSTEENVKPGPHTIEIGYADRVVTVQCVTLASHVYETSRNNCVDKGNRPDVWQEK